MKQKQIFAILFSGLISLLAINCSEKEKTSSGSDKENMEAIMKADSGWAVAATNVDGHMSYFADDAIVLPPNEPVIKGKDAIRKTLEGMYAMPGFGVTWKAEMADGSGSVGYSRGSYELKMSDSAGKAMTDKGKYLTVWKKQSDGSWKVVADMFSSDMPAGGH